jgi:excisionase family DNA binding protein
MNAARCGRLAAKRRGSCLFAAVLKEYAAAIPTYRQAEILKTRREKKARETSDEKARKGVFMQLLTIKEVAEELRLAPITIRRMIRARTIPYHRLGGKYLFTPEDLAAYLEAAAVPARRRAKETGHE